MFAIDSLSSVTIFLGSLFLRELWLIPSTVALAGKEIAFSRVLAAGLLGMIANDVWWFLMVRFAPSKIPHMFSRNMTQGQELPVRAQTFVGLLLAVSVVFGARLFVLFKMAQRRVPIEKAVFSIAAANVIWGGLIVSASWVFGKEFGHIFAVYRPVAMAIFVGLIIFFLVRRLSRSSTKA